MANVEHSTLTGANLHEPKGIELASSGDILVADGAASGIWTSPQFDNVVVVDTASDFPTAVAGVITLAGNTTYNITGDVDIGSDRIEYSTGSSITGFSRNTDILRTNQAGALLTAVGLHFQVTNVRLSNPSGTLMDVDGDSGAFGAIANTIVIGNCAGIGIFTDCDSAVLDTVTVLGNITATNAVQFSGAFNELFIRISYFKNWAGNCIDLVTNSPTFEIITILGTRFFGAASLVAIDGLPASANVNSLGAIMSSVFEGMTTPITGITKGDDQWVFKSNAGLENSAIIGFVSMTANVVETVVTTVSVPVKITGTTVADPNNERFTAPSDDRLDFNGPSPTQVTLTANVSSIRVGGGLKVHSATFYKNGSIMNANIQSAGSSSADPQNATITGIDTANNGDYYEVYISNETDNANIIVSDLQFSIQG